MTGYRMSNFFGLKLTNCAIRIVVFVILIGVCGCDQATPGNAINNDTSDETKSTAAAEKPPTVKPIAKKAGEITPADYVSGTGSTGKFVELAPAETGLDLVHIWNPPPKHRSLIVGTFGCGVAIGDYDNDGWQDVFVARQSDAGRLYRNLSGMKFEDVTEKVGIDPAGFWAVGTTFVDVNNDGLLDLYICGFDCPNRLYINQGGWFSEQAAKYGLDFSGSSIVMNFSDYDLDGDLDAYLVTNFKKPDSVIRKKQLIREPGKPPRVAPEFLERFFLVKHPDGGFRRSKAGQFDHLYRNDNGKFVEVTEEAGIGWQPYIGLSSNWWDYNSDGWPDLYVANDFKGPDLLYRNNGRGADGKVTFTEVSKDSLPHTPWYSMGSDFGDINNDGRFDYLASDMAGTNHYRDKLSMGSMSGPDSSAWFLNAVDPPQYMRNALYLNTGTENFGEIAFLSGLAKSDWTWTVKLADFDNDGWQDVYFTNGMTRDLFNSDLKNDLSKIVADKKSKAAADGSQVLPAQIAMDFWKKQPPFELENMAFKNKGNLKFQDVGNAWGLDQKSVSMGAAVGDLDNDGDLDIVVQGFEEPVRLLRNDLEQKNSIRFQLIGNECNHNAFGARVDLRTAGSDSIQTRYVSPTRGFMSTSESILHFGLGDEEAIESARIHWPGGSVQELTNLTANRTYRIVQAEQPAEIADANTAAKPIFKKLNNEISKLKHSELNYNDFERQPLLPNKLSELGPGISWGDVDGDGDDDLFIGGAAYSLGQIVMNLGDGKFERKRQSAFEADRRSEDMGSLFLDVDGDQDLDLYVVSGGVECEPGDAVLQDRLYLNDGTGNFEKANGWVPELLESGAAVAAVDFDKDGDLDLVVGGRVIPGSYPEAPRSVLLRNQGDKFEDATDEVAPELAKAGMVTALVWSDIDGDSWSDLLVATDWGPVRVYKNDSGKLKEQTEQAGLSDRLGWYSSICAGDIDNDGDTDFIVGNTGLNTKYKATPEKPELLFYGDFEGVGRKRIVEAKYEGDVCLPRRGLSCSSHAMPMVKEKKPTYHEFAISSLVDIYTDEKLDEATRFEANNLESCILINDSDESSIKFSYRSLPNLAQASPIFGCQLVDVDGDGNLDLYVVQNFYGPQRETGYMDGGVSQLFSGNGKGEFSAVFPAESGLLVTGDATSLTVVDFNGDKRPDFLVGKNNSASECFVNQTEETAFYSLNLAREAKEANDAKVIVGTKVVAQYLDGSKRLHEVRAGEGYLSQSAPVLFLGMGTAKSRLSKLSIQWPDGTTQDRDIQLESSVSAK